METKQGDIFLVILASPRLKRKIIFLNFLKGYLKNKKKCNNIFLILIINIFNTHKV